MPRFPGIRRLLHISRGRAGIEAAVEDELRFHFDMTVRELMANGMNADDARREAERRFGNIETHRSRLAAIDRAGARAQWWSAFRQDLRYALRGIRLKPGFALAVITTLALGIGANATMFGIVDRLLFRPPGYLAANDRVNRIYISRFRRGTVTQTSITGYQRYADLREWTSSFDAMAPFSWNYLAVGTGDETKVMDVGLLGADGWKMFDAKPVIGRFYRADEDAPPTGANVVVLSYTFWQTRYGGRASVLGTTIDIGSKRYTVIGVAPEGFSAFSQTPLVAFIPMSAASTTQGPDWYTRYTASWFEIFARRKPGVSNATASADLNVAYQRSYRAQIARSPNGAAPFDVAKPTAFAGPLLLDRGPRTGDDAKVATWLAGVAGIVLLIACANVANLLLARALRRRREIAVRLALGISRSRLVTQLVTESMVLSLAGGIVGVALARWGGSLVRTTFLTYVSAESIVDSRLLMFASALAVVTGLITGLAPVLQARRSDVASSLKAGSRDGTTQRSTIRRGLLVGQAALSVVLLVGAGLFLRSLHNVRTLRLGYDADRLVWLEPASRGVTLDSVQRLALRQKLLARALELPGIERAARALTVPFYSNWEPNLFTDGIDSVNKLGRMTLQGVSPGFFETMGTRILRGRAITAEDRAGSARVIVLGESMAKRIWPNEDAIGKCVRVSQPTAPCSTVIGIAEDVRRDDLSKVEMHYYLAIEQHRTDEGGIFVRLRGSSDAETEEIRRSLQTVMPGASYLTATSLSRLVGDEMRSWRLGATMFTVFGGLALVLAAVGLYSVIAYSVTQRTHEMGVRVALGAEARDVIALVVREGFRVVIPGVTLGAVAALAAGRWIAPLLFDVSPTDPAVLVSVIATLILVATTASWIPAMRASRVDPNVALRAD